MTDDPDQPYIDPQAHRLATSGVAGLIHPDSKMEQLQRRRDTDRARWLGVDTFTRPATPAEQALISTLPDVQEPGRVSTRVCIKGGLYRRSWPSVGCRTDRPRHVLATDPAPAS